MLRTDLLLGDFETAVSVYRWEGAELLRMEGPSVGAALVYIPETDERGRRERESMESVRFAGVPECRGTIDAKSGATALIFEGAADARPLALVHDLPEPTSRAGLVALLATLRFAHSRGVVHGRIDRSVVLVDSSGRFWLTGWADARPASSARPVPGVMGDVSADLRDLARAFREALLRRPWPDPDGAKVHERDARTPAGQELIDAGVRVDRDFARVLSRLVTADPRDAYTGATDVLADVGAVDVTAFDPWECVRPIGVRREVARVMRFLDDTKAPASESVRHASSIDFVSPDGGGKSRLLAEIARVARSRNAIVLTAEGGARGAWGGVGFLARQLVQLLGRSARTCVQHEEALHHLLGEHDAVAPPATSLPGLDGRDSLISACTAAVTDLVRVAFRRTPGLLLLDDEDRLPQSAHQVWRSTGQLVQAANGGGGVLHALLVSTSTRTYPAELGADRIVVPLRTWRTRDLEKFLAGAFGTPGGARDASVAIHRVTGGRPGDVVAYLRDLERKGALEREGLRWRIATPLSALPPLAADQADQVRRAVDSVGRDAASLVECLAVASDVSLTREALSGLCELCGPRLASAADAAVAAGLLDSHGAAWRVRTNAVAHKVYAAIPDERRRVLHREVLTHLLDAAPDAIDSIAVHARASSDPRAVGWTQGAINRAKDNGQWATALRHVEDAISSATPGHSTDEARISRLEFLLALGRVGEVIESIGGPDGTRFTGAADAIRATLLLAHAHYESREWEIVAHLAVPETGESSAEVCELRFLRAAAMRHLNRVCQSAREARLANAELDTNESVRVKMARLEYEYVRAIYSGDWPLTRQALVQKLRIARRSGDARQLTANRVKLGNAARYFHTDPRKVQAILSRAVATCRSGVDVGGTVKSALYAALGYNCWPKTALRRGYRHFSKSAFFAMESGAASLAIASRIRLVSWGVSSGVVAYEDKRYVQGIMREGSPASRSAVLSACVDLGLCLLYYSLQDDLEALLRKVRETVGDDPRARPLCGFANVGRMWLDEPVDPSEGPSPVSSPRELVVRLKSSGISELWICSIAYCSLRTEWKDNQWLRRLNSRRVAFLTRQQHFPGWGRVTLALALALWIPIEYDALKWNTLVAVGRRFPGPLPIALEWQRVVMESREFRRTGDWHLAQAAIKEAEAQLRLLQGPEYGVRGRRAVESWTRRLFPDRAVQAAPNATVVNDLPSTGTPPPDAPDVLSPVQWRTVIESAWSQERTVITSHYARELEEFSKSVVTKGSISGITTWKPGTDRFQIDETRSVTLLLVLPELWSTAQVHACVREVAKRDRAISRVITLLTVPLRSLRDMGSVHTVLCEQIDGAMMELPPICSSSAARLATFHRCLLAAIDGVEVDQATETEVANYSWPGGLAEMERVCKELAVAGATVVDIDALEKIGWWRRTDEAGGGNSAVERALLQSLRASGGSSIGSLSTATGCPRRTLLRYLNALVIGDLVSREGRGRATQYRLRPHVASRAGAGGVAPANRQGRQ